MNTTTKIKLLVVIPISLIWHSLFIGLFVSINNHWRGEMTTSFLVSFALLYLSLLVGTIQEILSCFREDHEETVKKRSAILKNSLWASAIVASYWDELLITPFRAVIGIGMTLLGLYFFTRFLDWFFPQIPEYFQKKARQKT